MAVPDPGGCAAGRRAGHYDARGGTTPAELMTGPFDAPGPPDPYRDGPFGPAGRPGGPPPPPWGPVRSTNGLAIASLVLAIVGLCTCFLGSVAAVVCGVVAMGQIDEARGAQEGRGLAVAGTAIGGVGIVLGVAALAFLVLVGVSTDSGEDDFPRDPSPTFVEP